MAATAECGKEVLMPSEYWLLLVILVLLWIGEKGWEWVSKPRYVKEVEVTKVTVSDGKPVYWLTLYQYQRYVVMGVMETKNMGNFALVREIDPTRKELIMIALPRAVTVKEGDVIKHDMFRNEYRFFINGIYTIVES